MKTKIQLARTGFGYVASLVGGMDDMDNIELIESETPQSTCALAARKLRRLARKFEELAIHEKPSSIAAQKEVNARKRLEGGR